MAQITTRGFTEAEYKSIRVLAAHANVSINGFVLATMRALIKAEATKLNPGTDSDSFKRIQRELREDQR